MKPFKTQNFKLQDKMHRVNDGHSVMPYGASVNGKIWSAQGKDYLLGEMPQRLAWV